MENLLVTAETPDQSRVLKAFFDALNIRYQSAEDPNYSEAFLEKMKQSDADLTAGRYTDVRVEDLDKYFERL